MSVEGDISAGCMALVTALGLPGVTVTERDVPTVQEAETPPLVIVSVTEDRFEPGTADADNRFFGYYTLRAVIARRANDTATSAETVRTWRDAIRRAVALSTLMALVPIVDEVTPVGRPTFDLGTLNASWKYVPVAWSVRTREPGV